MIRFGTGDLAYVTDEPCPCGRTANRVVKIVGRLDQVTKVKGMFIHPGNADEVANRFSEIDRYQVVVDREGHVDQMTFFIELKKGVEPSEALSKAIEAAIPQAMRVRGKVVFVAKGTLPADIKKIDDRRKWE
jgi:phenylacetate-CoA ligase